MPHRPPAASRRAVLVATLAATAGCSVDSLDPTSDDPTPVSTGTGPAGGDAAPADREVEADADARLVTTALTALALAHRTAAANARLHPGLAGPLRRLERLHRAHAAELGGLPESRGRVADPGEAPAQVLARVDRAEARLQQALVAASVAAGSGALAQTFAAMAAGTAQLRSVVRGTAA